MTAGARDTRACLLTRALVVSAPLLFLLACYRFSSANRYFSYALPALGDFPKGALFDLAFICVLLVGWMLVAPFVWARRIFLGALVPAALFIVLFRVTDHYYHLATGLPLNGYVLYGNVAHAQEGLGIVRHAPFLAVVAMLTAVHFAVFGISRRYRRRLEFVSDAWCAGPRALIAVPAVLLLLLLAINTHALAVHPQRRATLLSFAIEYEFLRDLPAFYRQKAREQKRLAKRPDVLLLPDLDSVTRAGSASGNAPTRRPDIFLITVESFNSVYTIPPADLHPALTEHVMPFFRSLGGEGLQFSNVYTSSAYTFNGIVAVLCSQYTMDEVSWGNDCLPELLARHGYQPFSFISVRQLRPYRYENFVRLGFPRANVFDAVRIREGKRNVFYDFMLDREVFDFAAAVTDSMVRITNRQPLFVHIATNQMHVPGYSNAAVCKPYKFPAGLEVTPLTRGMINAAHCTDQDLANYMGQLKQQGLYDNALIIVTGDHAFNIAFWDHRETELARVPLFVKFPKADSVPLAINTGQLSAQIDIAPTIIDHLGVATSRPMYGRSLLRNFSDENRSIPGISSSRMASLATRTGLALHMEGKADLADSSARTILEQLLGTVSYFDQNPEEFVKEVHAAAQRKRVAAPNVVPPVR